MTFVSFVLLDAIILNSLCEMFGLLDSVKQALDVRCSQNQENKTYNRVYGKKTVKGSVQDISLYSHRLV